MTSEELKFLEDTKEQAVIMCRAVVDSPLSLNEALKARGITFRVLSAFALLAPSELQCAVKRKHFPGRAYYSPEELADFAISANLSSTACAEALGTNATTFTRDLAGLTSGTPQQIQKYLVALMHLSAASGTKAAVRGLAQFVSFVKEKHPTLAEARGAFCYSSLTLGDYLNAIPEEGTRAVVIKLLVQAQHNWVVTSESRLKVELKWAKAATELYNAKIACHELSEYGQARLKAVGQRVDMRRASMPSSSTPVTSLTESEQKFLMETRVKAEQLCSTILTSPDFYMGIQRLCISPKTFWAFAQLLPRTTYALLRQHELASKGEKLKVTAREIVKYTLENRATEQMCCSHFGVSNFHLKAVLAEYERGNLSQIQEYIAVRMLWDLALTNKSIQSSFVLEFADFAQKQRPSIDQARAWLGGHGATTIYSYLNALAKNRDLQRACVLGISEGQLQFVRSEQKNLDTEMYHKAVYASKLLEQEQQDNLAGFYVDWRRVTADVALKQVADLVLNKGYRLEELQTVVTHDSITSCVELLDYMALASDKQLMTSVSGTLCAGYAMRDVKAVLLLADLFLQGKSLTALAKKRHYPVSKFQSEGIAILGAVNANVHQAVYQLMTEKAKNGVNDSVLGTQTGFALNKVMGRQPNYAVLPDIYMDVMKSGYGWSELLKKYGSLQCIFEEMTALRGVNKHRADELCATINQGYSTTTVKRILRVCEDILCYNSPLSTAVVKRYSSVRELELVGVPILMAIMPEWVAPIKDAIAQSEPTTSGIGSV